VEGEELIGGRKQNERTETEKNSEEETEKCDKQKPEAHMQKNVLKCL
jgi:hypothetical protein